MIKTRRLNIRKASIADAEFLSKLYNSPKFLRFIGDRGIINVDRAEQYIKDNFTDSYFEHGFGLMIVELGQEKRPIGVCGLVKRDYLEFPDLGYAILPAFENRGYITEACTAVLKHGVDYLQLNDILAICQPENQVSRYLLEKLGFKKKGSINNEGEDLLLYSFEET